MSFPQARPTTYRGIQMRSRLEARYAARLDDLALKWTYEPRAFGGRGGQYLPDFEVAPRGPGHFFVEVRPTMERAMLAFPAMQIILESDPSVPLLIVYPEDSNSWSAFKSVADDRTWRAASLVEL